MMSLSRIADLEEDNDRLRDQLGELETELGEARAEINEFRAQLEAKEEGATTHRQIERRAGVTWVRDITIIAPEWEPLPDPEAEA